MFSFPLLAITNHAPPASHGSFAKQKAAISKNQLLALRCTVDSGSEDLLPDSMLAAWLGDMDTRSGRVSAVTAHFTSLSTNPFSLLCCHEQTPRAGTHRGSCHTRLHYRCSALDFPERWWYDDRGYSEKTYRNSSCSKARHAHLQTSSCKDCLTRATVTWWQEMK